MLDITVQNRYDPGSQYIMQKIILMSVWSTACKNEIKILKKFEHKSRKVALLFRTAKEPNFNFQILTNIPAFDLVIAKPFKLEICKALIVEVLWMELLQYTFT